MTENSDPDVSPGVQVAAAVIGVAGVATGVFALLLAVPRFWAVGIAGAERIDWMMLGVGIMVPLYSLQFVRAAWTGKSPPIDLSRW